MTYAELEALIESIALETLGGSGHFHCGNDLSLKLAVEEKGYPVVHLDPISGNRNIQSGNKTASVTIGFFEQGAVDLSAKEEQVIYARQEVVSAHFLAMLQEEDEVGDIAVRDTPVKNYTDQLLSGIACEFELKLPISLCF
ncbi:hypothetical protein OB13_10850 [Pontibacter sp. HJ8]